MQYLELELMRVSSKKYLFVNNEFIFTAIITNLGLNTSKIKLNYYYENFSDSKLDKIIAQLIFDENFLRISENKK